MNVLPFIFWTTISQEPPKKGPQTQTSSTSAAAFERRAVTCLKRLSHSGAAHEMEGQVTSIKFHEGNHRTRFNSHKPPSKSFAVTTHRSNKRHRKGTHPHNTFTKTPKLLQIRKQSVKVQIQTRCHNYQRGSSFRGPISLRRAFGRISS